MQKTLARYFLLLLLIAFNCCFSQSGKPVMLTPRMLDSISMAAKGKPVTLWEKAAMRLAGPGLADKEIARKNVDLNPVAWSNTEREAVAYCYDTSSRFFLTSDNHSIYPTHVIRTSDGNLLFCGDYGDRTTLFTSAMVVSVTPQGKKIWAKAFDTAGAKSMNAFSFRRLLELKDRSIMVAGYVKDGEIDGFNFILLRLASNGTILWSQIYKSQFWGKESGSAYYWNLCDMKEDPASGDVFFTGAHWDQGRNITRIDRNNGKVVWSREYQQYNGGIFDQPFGLDLEGRDIISIGKMYNFDVYLGIYRLNKQTGDTIETRYMKVNDTAGIKVSFLGANQMTRTDNGHFLISGTTYGFYEYNWDSISPLTHAGVAEFDGSLNFVRASVFRNNVIDNGYATLTSVFKDGSGMFTLLSSSKSLNTEAYYVQFKNGQLLRQRKRRYEGQDLPWEIYSIPTTNGGLLDVKIIEDYTEHRAKTEFLNLHVSDTSSACLGYDDYRTFMQPVNYQPASYGLDSISAKDFFVFKEGKIVTSDISFDLLPGCRTISHCDSVKLVPQKKIACVSDGLSFVLRKNPACGALPFFAFDSSAITSFTHTGDSSYHISFRGPWRGQIHASISSCLVAEDSMEITVLGSPPPVDLGNDTSLCPGGTLLLHAGSGFASYRWQDGSADSVLQVKTSGKYFVDVVNACGSMSTDTIIVSAKSFEPLDLGGDRKMCRGDSVVVNVPPGFVNYQWYPNYRLKFSSEQQAILSPLVDTVYTLIAEKSPGCFAKDSFRVIVSTVPRVNLGNDTSFCEGQNIRLDAGLGFDHYSWNTGSDQQLIPVTKTGLYAVDAVSGFCHARDTLRVLSVEPLPVFSLGQDDTLCEGTKRSYQFKIDGATYLWNTGSHNGNYDITTAGIYWLRVSRAGCDASDTVTVSYKPVPVVGLGPDTTLCPGDLITLNAFYPGAAYLWQDGSTSAQSVVNAAGLYQVTLDLDGCLAADSIQVSYLPLPKVSLGADLLLCKGQTLLLTPDISGASSWQWQDGSSNKTLLVSGGGLYFVKINGQCGMSTDTVNVEEIVCRLKMPSAFTPDGDGLNDLFRVKYPFPVQHFSMQIFDRWGSLVFNSSSIYNGWNGKIKGMPAQPASYVWLIRLVDSDGNIQQDKGTVTLIR